jgi:glyoxylase I family protein
VSTRPFTLLGIDHIVLRVSDPLRMLAFYRDVLGCPVERTQPQLGLTQLRAGAALIDLVTRDGPLGRKGPEGPGRNLEHFCLRVRPFAEGPLSEWLAAHGAQPHDPAARFGAEGEGPSLYLEDPEGNTIELKGARD